MSRRGDVVPSFKINPDVRRTSPGAPPSEHERRCQSFNSSGLQCGRWALREQRFCEFHGGSVAVSVGKKNMSWSYKKYAGPTLRAKLEEIGAGGEDALYDLSGEAEIMKSLCERAFVTFDQVVLQGKLDKDGVMNMEARMSAQSLMKQSIEDVTKLVEKIAKINALRRQQQPIINAGVIAAKITEILHKELEEAATTPEEKLAARRKVESIAKQIQEMRLLKDDTPASKVILSID